jgi:hypothetical protein
LYPLQERFGSEYRCFFYDLSAWRGLKENYPAYDLLQARAYQESQTVEPISIIPSCPFFK